MSKPSRDVLRLARPFPIIGQIAALSYSRETLNEKGAGMGGLDIALDLIPFVGRMKGLFEIFSGDLLTEKNVQNGIKTMRKALDEIEALCNSKAKDVSPKAEMRVEETQPEEQALAPEEPRFYPENSAKIAAMRAKLATKTPYERRVYPGLQPAAETELGALPEQ